MFRQQLKTKVASFIVLSDNELGQLEAHYELMKRWNRVLNLTRIEVLEEVVERHYAESLFVAAHLPKRPQRIVDIGSGAGFPGFPVAVVRPDCLVTLVESHQRKAVFLKEASRGMPNVRVLSKRADRLGETFDFMVSRAVRWRDLAELEIAAKSMMLCGPEVEGTKIPLPWGKSRFLVSRETIGA